MTPPDELERLRAVEHGLRHLFDMATLRAEGTVTVGELEWALACGGPPRETEEES